MDFINLLSESDSKKLIELATQLKELSEKEEELVNQSTVIVEKGEEVIDTRHHLIDKSKDYVVMNDGKPTNTLNSAIDSEEFIDLMNNLSNYKNEQKEIQKESGLVNKELENINNERKIIKEKIDELLSKTAKQDVGININDIGIVHIVDAKLPEDKEKLSKDLCEIINCKISFIKEISNIYNNNITDILVENDVDEFAKLKNYVLNYKNQNTLKYEEQLEMVNKLEDNNKVTDSTTETEEKPIIDVDDVKEDTNSFEENKQDESVEEKVVLDNIVNFEKPNKIEEEPIAVIKDPVTLEVISEIKPDNSEVKNEEKNDNIVSISDIIGNNEKELETIIKEDQKGIKTLYTLISDKVTPNQIARATKDKLYNKIALIFKGSYPETKVERVNSLNEVNTNNGFNIENFVTNKAA